MFSRNRCNGQDGTGLPQYPRPKKKTAVSKRRQPNPRVALVLRGKIHRLLQGSSDHAVQPSGLYNAGIEEVVEEGEEVVEKLQHYKRRGLDSGEVYDSPKVPNGHAMAAVLEAPCVGEVELNREGGIKIPCTLQHNSTLAVVQNQIIRDLNGKESSSRRGLGGNPKIQKDPLLYRFNMTVQDNIVEGNEDYLEEESSAIIEHILKELQGINKIQEEISDLREYLSSVRGSVEEVSSCVDAVLMEIECMRSGTKSGVETWPASHPKSNNTSTQICNKPNTVESASSCGDILSGYQVLYRNCREAQSQGLTCQSFRSKSMCANPVTYNENIPITHEAPYQSSDASQRVCAGKLSFGYLECQDGQDYPSTSSLSSIQSSKSETDPERVASVQCKTGHESKNRNPASLEPNGTVEARWSENDSCSRQGSFEEMEFFTGEVGSLDLSGAEVIFTRGSSDQLSSKHYNSPSSTCSREDMTVEQFDTGRLPEELGLGFHQRSEVYDSVCLSADIHASFLNPTKLKTDFCKSSSCESCPVAFTSVHASGCVEPFCKTSTTDKKLLNEGTSFCIQGVQECEFDLANTSNVAINVKKFGRAVFDFKSSLRGALKKPVGIGEKVEVNPRTSPCGEKKYPNVLNIRTAKGEVPQMKMSLKTVSQVTNAEKTEPQDKPEYEDVEAGEENCHHDKFEDSEHSKFPELDSVTKNASDTSGHFTNAAIALCCSTDIISQSLSHELGTEELKETLGEEMQTPTESSSEFGGSEAELSQNDARRLKCIRNFQHILREKRESRRHLSMVTTSTFLEEDLNADGSQDEDQVISFSHLRCFFCGA